jgi:anti-sigma factor RsiW
MNPMDKLDPRLLETLSVYLDGGLEGAEKAALEARLNKEESLRWELAELRSVRDSLRALPLLKPPRSLALTPAMAGKATGKSGVFSPRRMALGSALASLAFVCVLSIDVLSHGGFLAASTAPQVLPANEAFSAPRQSVDTSGAGKSAATAGAAGPVTTETPSPVATPRIGTGSDNSVPTETPTEAPSPSHLMGGGCGDCAPTEEMAAKPTLVVTEPIVTVTQPSALPDFQTVAPYLEALLGLAAVLLAASAALAVIIVRRRR